MAGAFSGHLINSFHAQQPRHPVIFDSQNSNIVTNGAISFNAQMHGSSNMGNYSMSDQSFAFGSMQPSFFKPELSEETALKIAALQAKLNQKLGPEYISQRPGPGGGPKLTYAEGWKIINLANEVFGFNGWCSNVVNITTDFIDFNEESRRFNVGVTAIIRVTLRDGVFHEDIGYGMLENSKSKGAAIDKCKKEAVTDGLKRALRNFGNLMGNCLYDKTYTQEVVKIKVQQPKFDKSELHRRPEFEETKPNVASSGQANSSRMADITTSLSSGSEFEDIKPNVSSSSAAEKLSRMTKISTNLPKNNEDPKPISARSSNHSSRLAQIAANLPSNTDALRIGQLTSVPGPDTSSKSTLPESVKGPASIGSHAQSINPPKESTSPAVGFSKPLHRDLEVSKEDDSFHFGSEDDAFLASVDLGDGDLGQPLLPETDLGRPLFNEMDNNQSFNIEEAQAQSSLPGLQQQQTAPGIGMLSRLLPQHQQRQHQSSSSSSNQQGNLSKQQQQQWRAANSNHQSNPQQGSPQFTSASNVSFRNSNVEPSHQNQNRPPAPAGKPVSTGARPSTPSMGGFHFPPGVDPQKLRGQTGIGLKRPFDAVSSSTTKPVQIHYGQGQPVKREVLGSLDLGDPNLKRARR